VELFDEHGIIHPNDDLLVKVAVPQAFQVDEETKNGTYHYGKSIKLGVHKVLPDFSISKIVANNITLLLKR